MPLPREAVERALEDKLGFDREDSDHRRFSFNVGGVTVARTMTSHGTKYRELGDNLLGQIARQLHVSRPFFVALVRCTRSREEYLNHLRQRGMIR